MADNRYNDAQAQADKLDVMRKQRRHSLFYSTSDTFKFLAAVTLAAGMAIVGTALKGATTMAAATAAVSGSTVGLTFLGVAAALTALAIGSNYIATRYYTTANYDALEINAQHTAKYLVKEIKKENACVAEHPGRSDGKTWVETVKAHVTHHRAQL